MASIITCPTCSKRLQVPDDLVGQDVQCPECKATFVAVGDAVPESPAREEPPLRPTSRPGRGYEDDEADELEDRPRRRPRRARDAVTPHRGGMILAFGILAIVFLPIVFGPLAWVMGNADLREIREGRMDPEGEGMTQAGRIMGIVMTLLFALAMVMSCVLIGLIFCMAGLAADRPPGRF